MSSGAANVHYGTFVGAAGVITIDTLPFKPKAMQFFVASGGAIEQGYKTEDMAGDAYLSTSTGVDAGVTFNTDGSVTIANGADINVAAGTVHYRAEN